MRTSPKHRSGSGYSSGYRYGRDIVAVLCLKAAALGLLYFLLVAPAEKPAATAHSIAAHLLAGASGPHDSEKHDDR